MITFGEEATDEMITRIYNIAGGIHRHVDMIIPRIADLKAKNFRLLESGGLKMSKTISLAGSRLMIG